jgi:hypothetical protein
MFLLDLDLEDPSCPISPLVPSAGEEKIVLSKKYGSHLHVYASWGGKQRVGERFAHDGPSLGTSLLGVRFSHTLHDLLQLGWFEGQYDMLPVGWVRKRVVGEFQRN